MSLLERLMTKTLPEPNSGCWLWTGAFDDSGYGEIWTGRERTPREKAHRVSYKLHCGDIPGGMLVRHKCDVRACVNPAHLEIGTIADNVADRDGRKRQAVGHKINTTKLNAEKVRAIRASNESTYALARRYGVHNTTIFDIIRGNTWRHVA